MSSARVTRLGEISPNKRLATFGQFLKMKEEAKIFVLHISTEKSFFIILPKKNILGKFSSKTHLVTLVRAVSMKAPATGQLCSSAWAFLIPSSLV
jgi:hypothetical protein